MSDLPYQTFGSPNRVFIGADANITVMRYGTADYPHTISVKDANQAPVLELCLTAEAAATLADLLTVPTDPNPTPWADLDMARLGATGVVAFT